MECEMTKTERSLQREPLKKPDHTRVRGQRSGQLSLTVEIWNNHLYERDTAPWISNIFQLLPASWMILFTDSAGLWNIDWQVLVLIRKITSCITSAPGTNVLMYLPRGSISMMTSLSLMSLELFPPPQSASKVRKWLYTDSQDEIKINKSREVGEKKRGWQQ